MNIAKLFKTTKKAHLVHCAVNDELISEGSGFLLTTAEVVQSKKYWDYIMTAPETLSYTLSHFSNQSGGTQMRSLIFDKYSGIKDPWIISDTCIGLFEINRNAARECAHRWWEENGSFTPDNCGPAIEILDTDTFREFRDYAILEAGRSRAEKSKLYSTFKGYGG